MGGQFRLPIETWRTRASTLKRRTVNRDSGELEPSEFMVRQVLYIWLSLNRRPSVPSSSTCLNLRMTNSSPLPRISFFSGILREFPIQIPLAFDLCKTRCRPSYNP